ATAPGGNRPLTSVDKPAGFIADVEPLTDLEPLTDVESLTNVESLQEFDRIRPFTGRSIDTCLLLVCCRPPPVRSAPTPLPLPCLMDDNGQCKMSSYRAAAVAWDSPWRALCRRPAIASWRWRARAPTNW